MRVASPNNGSSIHFVVDGTSYPSLLVPNTGNWQVYTNIESGTAYAFAKGSTHTVRLVCDTGGFNINYWQYHNDIPMGETVTLRSAANNLFVSAPNSSSPLIANQTAAGLSEQFQLVDESSSYWYGCVALKSLGNGLFVSADPTGASPLAANGSNAGASQTFQWSDNGDGTISLRAVVNNMDVTAENAGALPLINNRINTGPWETFSVATVPAKITTSLSSSNLTLSWRTNYLGWILQTNRVGLGAGGAWGNVPGSQTNTQASFPINNPAAPMVFFRLRHP